MLRVTFTSLVKYLIGIFLVQAAAALTVVTALKTSLAQTGVFFLLLNLTIGVMTALWFSSVAEHARSDALARAQQGFSRERERIRVRAERDKLKEVKSSQRQARRGAARGGSSGDNLKTGLAIGGAVGVGVVMLTTQLFTLGLLTMSLAGGAALGYRVRARQDRLPDRLPGTAPSKRIEVVATNDAEHVEPAQIAPPTRGPG